MLGDVHNAVCGEGLHGDRHLLHQAASAATREAVQVGGDGGRHRGWELSLSHGASANPHVQRERGIRQIPFLWISLFTSCKDSTFPH